MPIELTDLDISVILKEKPYNINTAIQYADELTMKYNKLYCVVEETQHRPVKNKYKRKKFFSIISFGHFRNNIPIYQVYYITKLKR